MRKANRYHSQVYIDGILSGDRVLLSRALTLVESTLPEDYELAQAVITACMPYTGNAFRLGITGVPGAGKSTFIEAFGMMIITKMQKKIAVLAIDPTSEISGGSILGDKTRMHELSAHPAAFIRPSPACGTLGGVARKTRESLLLCEAAGFDMIIVETVGVGQSETMVSDMTDFFLLLMLPNAGDELQGLKKGIMEKADALIINKADGDFLAKARLAKTLYSQALRLFMAKESGWRTPVLLCSALEKQGIADVWQMLIEYQSQAQSNQFWQKNRQEQLLKWMLESVQDRLQTLFFQDVEIVKKIPILEQLVLESKLSPLKAADQLVKLFFNS